MSDERSTLWWETEEDDVAEAVFLTVEAIEREQSEVHERFLKLACLYDPRERMGLRGQIIPPGAGVAAKNVCQTAVDTLTSFIAKSRTLPTYMTDGADWSTQRLARKVEWYIRGLFRQTKYFEKRRRKIHDGTVLGTGALKIYKQRGRIVVDRVLADEIVADEREWSATPGRTLHHRRWVDRGALLKEFGRKKEDAIEAARTAQSQRDPYWAGYRNVESSDLILCIESYRLPSYPGAGDGRRVWALPGGGLLVDEEWTQSYFPLVFYRHNTRLTGFYGRGLVEELADLQQRVNNLTRFQDMVHDLIAIPRIYVHHQDMEMQAKISNRIGAIIGYRNRPPTFNTAPAVAPESYQRLEKLETGALEQARVSQMSAYGRVPSGFETGAAVRELAEVENEAFSMQFLSASDADRGAAAQMLFLAKEMGDDRPQVSYRRRQLGEEIDWDELDTENFPLEFDEEQSSGMAKTPSGRRSTAIDLFEIGLLPADEARRLLQFPDIERSLALHNAPIEDIERTIEDLLDDNDVVPEPYQFLEMGVRRVQWAYLKAKGDGAPETVLENMRVWMTQAQDLLKRAQAGAATAAIAGPAMSALPAGPTPPLALPPGPGAAAPPTGPDPTAAGTPPLQLVS